MSDVVFSFPSGLKVTISEAPEQTPPVQTDLSNYYTKDEIDQMLISKVGSDPIQPSTTN